MKLVKLKMQSSSMSLCLAHCLEIGHDLAHGIEYLYLIHLTKDVALLVGYDLEQI